MTLTVGLLVTWRRWRRSSGLVQHHARQATLMNLGLHLLASIHVALHLLAWGAQAISERVDADSGGTGWAIAALDRIIFINWFTLGLAGFIAAALALKQATIARHGGWSNYPLLGDLEPLSPTADDG